MTRVRYYAEIAAMASVRHEHPHATNVIHDAFGPDDGLPFVSVVERMPMTAAPTTVHRHHGWNELIVMLEGEVVLWCGDSPDAIQPYRLVPGAMFLIASDASHVFVNGREPARWMIMFVPCDGTAPAASREDISRHHTVRGIAIPEDRLADVRRSFEALLEATRE